VETEEPIPSPKGPLEGTAEPPAVRPPADALVVGKTPSGTKPATDDSGAEPGRDDRDREEGDVAELSKRDRARMGLAKLIAPDGAEVVPPSPESSDESGS
jgi:hypothetical protein